MCDQQSLRSACTYAQSDQSLCLFLEYSMTVKLLTEHHLEFLSLKGGYTGSSESTLVKMPHCWKSHVTSLLIPSQSSAEFHHLWMKGTVKYVNKDHPCEQNSLSFVDRCLLFRCQILYKLATYNSPGLCSQVGLYSEVTANTGLTDLLLILIG